eukprot:CAMPEP_0195057400 /NCGR_PEP_ID=MMETSP0448-20130528/5529_1 /TAXON_ID=66468 /ORGANISM="Heterocapsa triquestra, Strain CCMP 448" /LENGTH=53 /DNA_ID=CAMNT_0040087377 /DNA_START=101 /DNA_END=262 /DNA_ORIENTATION=-
MPLARRSPRFGMRMHTTSCDGNVASNLGKATRDTNRAARRSAARVLRAAKGFG